MAIGKLWIVRFWYKGGTWQEVPLTTSQGHDAAIRKASGMYPQFRVNSIKVTARRAK